MSAACGPNADAQQVHESEEHRFRVDTVATGLENPWGIAFLPGGDMLVTERAGRVRVIRNGALQAEAVPGAPEVRARGQGGLLDIALHPRFAANRYVYLTYSKPGPIRATTAIARARFDGQRLEGLQDLLVTDAWGTGGNHFGSRIVFDSAGMMYITVGERNERQRAQNLGDHAGTVLRLHDDGRVPRDNPFVGRAGARPEIYSYGHRNAQGADLHPSTGELWLNEHGPRGGDEINIARAGRNYGWPVITFGREYSGAQITADTARAGMEQPVLHWTPSIAVSGMAFYTGDRFPGWRGNVFNGALAAQHLRRVVLDGNRAVHQESLLPRIGRIRTVKMGPDGYLYLLIDAPNGSVLRLVPA
ncbi:MAG TPA: PQQ-dependent sugar dehydrogenase [Gemmatimonadaceae bacterium]|nr:PQQ-dependent sugar dehydrogenase [Gemmatimonadaceae bacterium]